jgi:hypothetical protein
MPVLKDTSLQLKRQRQEEVVVVMAQETIIQVIMLQVTIIPELLLPEITIQGDIG